LLPPIITIGSSATSNNKHQQQTHQQQTHQQQRHHKPLHEKKKKTRQVIRVLLYSYRQLFFGRVVEFFFGGTPVFVCFDEGLMKMFEA
jgi:hypothetical protein